MEEKHSKYSPSKLTRIITCPGSVTYTKDTLETTSTYAQEGTAAHAMVEECLTLNESILSDLTKKKFKLEESYEVAVQEVLDWVEMLRIKHAASQDMYELVEQKVSLKTYGARTGCGELEEVAGTLDYCMVVPEEHLVYIVDWKFGAGIEVFPDTEQLRAYALGKLAGLTHQNITKVILVIGQPRFYGGEFFKTHETTPTDLFDWMSDELIPALNNAKSKHPIFNPTKKACQWCAKKATCKYRKSQAMEAAANVFKIHAKIPDNTDEEELAEFLYQIPDLKKYISDIELYAHNILKAGKSIPGFKLVAGRSIRRWVDEKAVKQFYLNLDEYELDDLTIIKLKSPTQLEKLVGKKNVTEDMLALVHKPAGKPTLVREIDKREALSYETATEKFSKFI